MRVNGEYFKTESVFSRFVFVPDCMVVNTNKLGTGHGEKKLYISSKDEMRGFYGVEGFTAECFMLKSDLIAYMQAIKNEYLEPSQEYVAKDDFPSLWSQRMEMISRLDDVIFFRVKDQTQIQGQRGYVNSDDFGYRLIREIALPLISYIYVEKVKSKKAELFYWKLFVDFDAIWEKKNGPLVFHYGERIPQIRIAPKAESEAKKNKRVSTVREGQEKYREQLLEQCRYCPFTKIADERLLIASHIKPWAASSAEERIDPYNGYILSPLYDRLFDRGFITFTKEKHIILSEFISSHTWKLIGLTNDTFLQALPMDSKREEYLKFHHTAVFKGHYDFNDD